MELLNNTANALIDAVVNPVVYVLSALAFVWFLYGVFMFIVARYNSDEPRIKTGKQHMLWGLIGLVIVYSANAIYDFITGFFN